MGRRSAATGVVLGWMLLWGGGSWSADVEKRPAGLYLVVGTATSEASLPAPTSEQRIVRCEYRFIAKEERGEPEYLLLPKKADVELILLKAPTLEEKAESGFPAIQLELTPAAAQNLEKLTREHLGQRVAFVVDDEPVTVHKIRSVISDGQLRITRCSDRGCQYIYGRLVGTP